jgi:AhpD family alkylhydroperoxidase
VDFPGSEEAFMEHRVDYTKAAPDVLQSMLTIGRYLAQSGLDPKLLDLVRLRVSQINCCAYCIDMHWKDLRAAGETEQRLYGLDAWAESPYYTDRERAALAWGESVTRLDDGHVADPVFNAARRFFSEKELADLTLCVVAINGWNRLNIAFRSPAGTYLPQSMARFEEAVRPRPPVASH